MPDEQQFKRNTAYKLRIGDILVGKPTTNGDRFSFLELGDRKIVRVNVIGNIVDKYESSGETKYISLTVDDGSGQIRIKAFGEEAERLRSLTQGQTVVVIGVLRHWNDELYVSPEIVRDMDPKYLVIRKLETEKDTVSGLSSGSVSSGMDISGKQQTIAVKDRILDLIKASESNGGVETESLLRDLQEFSPTILNKEIQKLLEEGVVFEPRPGKIRWLG